MALATRITISKADPKNPCDGRPIARIAVSNQEALISASGCRYVFQWAAPAKLQ
jgi:hypothetical protein